MATINNADYSLAPTRGLKGEMCKGGMKGGEKYRRSYHPDPESGGTLKKRKRTC